MRPVLLRRITALYIEKSVFDQVVDGVADTLRKLKSAPPRFRNGNGPRCHWNNRTGLQLTSIRRCQGAKAVAGGTKPPQNFCRADGAGNTNDDMKVVQEARSAWSRGVPCVTDPASFARARRRIWTDAASAKHRMADQIAARNRWITADSTTFSTQPPPSAGYKQSGWGAKWGTRSQQLHPDQGGCAREFEH